MFAFLGLGPGELAFFAVVLLVLFGSRLPTVMRGMGQGITEFKKGLREGEEEAKSESIGHEGSDDAYKG